MASVACDFFGSSFATTQDAVQGLLDSAAQTCGGQVFFYSAPGGLGRRNVVFDERTQKNDGFFLVASNGCCSSDSDFAPAEHACVMTLALETGVAWLGQLIAAAVYTSGILEGLLLIEMMPGTRPGTVSSARCDINEHERIRALASAVEWKGPAVLVPAMRLWAASLAERLEKMRLQEEAMRLTWALDNVLHTLEHLTLPDARLHEVDACATGMIATNVFPCSSPKACIDLWACDIDKQQLIGNNSGHRDGQRVDVDQEFAGKAMCNDQSIFCTSSLPDDRIQSKIAVPILQPHMTAAQAADRVVLEMTYKRPEGSGEQAKARIDHFGLVGAELLQCSAFPTVLWVRDRFLQLIAIERKRAGIHRVVTKLENTDDVTEAIDTLEHEVGLVMGCEACTLFFVDNRQGEIWAPPTETRVGICVGIDEGLVGYAASRAKEELDEHEMASTAIITNDPQSCPLWSGDVGNDFKTRNVLTVPVTSKGEHKNVLAVIQLCNKSATSDYLSDKASHYANVHGFTPSDAKLLEELAHAMGEFMQRHVLSVHWTKARYDNAALACNSHRQTCDLDEIPSIAYEYYQMKHGVKKEPEHVRYSQKRATCMMLEPSDVPEKHADIDQWSVFYWDLSDEEEYGLLVQAMRRCGVISCLSLSRQHLYRFFMAVRQHYRSAADVPYHNFHHAMSTLHYAFKMVQALECWTEFPVTSMMALLLAALCHDVDHRGRNNAFEAMTRSELALRYNDSSPLENHHCATAFQIAFNTPEGKCNVFEPLAAEEFESVRKHMVRWILATDMKHHGTHVEDVQKCLETGYNAENHHITLSTILHVADISNPMMPSEIAERWGQCLCEEFTQQANAERQLGLPVTPFMANLSTPEAMFKNHCGFIDFVIQPLVSPLFQAIPGLEPCHNFLQRNREAWGPTVPASPAGSEPESRGEEDRPPGRQTMAISVAVAASEKPSGRCSEKQEEKQRAIRRSNFSIIPVQTLDKKKGQSMILHPSDRGSEAGKTLPKSMQ